MRMPGQVIREKIHEKGVLTFAEFMETALYCPETGYYETEKNKVGRAGDFITSVSTGKLFGELLAFQFAEWLEAVSQKPEIRIVEAGCHDAKLAADILTWLQKNRPQLFFQLKYFIVEPSAGRQLWQRETLKEFNNVHWFMDFEDLKTQNSKLTGLIFSNELLDAFPIHRFGWDAKQKKWFEWGVTLQAEKFVWAHRTENLQPSTFNLQPELEAVLPDGYIIETSPAAVNWWRDAAGILAHGKLLAIDYGFTDDEMISPARTKGTLRAYHKHRVSDDVLAHAGEQDLTAHVNFSTIQKTGEVAGLTTESFLTQTKFLTQILAKTVAAKNFGDWDGARTRQFQTLTHPEQLGRAFRVLVQTKS